MKKALVFLGIFITFFVFYFLQIDFFNWFTIAGVAPNTFVILVLFVRIVCWTHRGICYRRNLWNNA